MKDISFQLGFIEIEKFYCINKYFDLADYEDPLPHWYKHSLVKIQYLVAFFLINMLTDIVNTPTYLPKYGGSPRGRL